ncbi:MAG TPA: proteasome accessory factor PafA2 family protein [Candidatus Tectomicrobia bacterium]|nr:proteasome accessory factor PafA2 family protein [Candidatus Tectomicrobia bacterium]
MSVPKVVGLEQEYGIVVQSRPDTEPITQVQAAFLLVNSYDRAHRGLWDYACETPFKSAMHRRRDRRDVRISDPENALTNNALTNGARYYVDHAHPEYATPECRSARDVVACDKAGECVIERSRQRANAALKGAHEIRVYKNNSDHKGNSYGCHENYTVDAHTYLRLFRETGLRELIPFLVSRQVICGAGKVGQENSSGSSAGYQLSQRADFCETVFSIKTMSGRPLLNTRDEPHADRRRFRRLHIILGDANMSEVSSYLKVGTTQLVLRMIEDRAITRDVRLDAPVQAVHDISLDSTCRAKVKLRDGRKLDAIEIQSAYLEMAQAYHATHVLDAEERTVLNRWERTLRLLREDPMHLRRELDWVIKKWLLEQQTSRHGLDWTAPRLRQLDIQYHCTDPDRSLFYLLQNSGQIDRLLDDAAIEHFVRHPTDDTRAYTRAMCLEKYGEAVWAVNWERVTFRLRDRLGRPGQEGKVLLLNPLRGTKADNQALFAQAETAAMFLDAAPGIVRGRR